MSEPLDIGIGLTRDESGLILIGLEVLRVRLTEISDSPNSSMSEQLRAETEIEKINALYARIEAYR